MALDVQRFPKGLAEVLGIYGISPKLALGEVAIPQLELLQFMGLSQLVQVGAQNAALAEAAAVSFVTDPTRWSILFHIQLIITKTATMTALRGSVGFTRTGSGFRNLATDDLGPFGATETGSVSVVWWAPYPVVCPPGTVIQGVPTIIGTDATANCGVSAEFGLLG